MKKKIDISLLHLTYQIRNLTKIDTQVGEILQKNLGEFNMQSTLHLTVNKYYFHGRIVLKSVDNKPRKIIKKYWTPNCLA